MFSAENEDDILSGIHHDDEEDLILSLGCQASCTKCAVLLFATFRSNSTLYI